MKRLRYLEKINEALRIHPVMGLLGPRQCGKTTLAHQFKRQHNRACHFFDLEDPEDLAALDNPKTVFESLEGTIIIDEIQRRPGLFPYLRTLVDKEKRKRKILILGSASRDLIQQGSESLAGRISYIELTPFCQYEIKASDQKKLWFRGGFPPSFLAKTSPQSFSWRKAYISTFMERDIPSLGIKIPARTLSRFWKMLSHYHSQVINYSEIGRSFGMADTTIRRYIDILTGTFMMRQLQPWHESIKKRQIKRPKIYFRDSGVYHTLLTVRNTRELFAHPKLGASWEGFAVEQVIQHFNLDEGEVFFWAVHGQGEIDLLFEKGGKKFGVEFKFSETPSLSSSMVFAKEQLNLDHVFCVYPGSRQWTLAPGIQVQGLSALKNL